MRDGIADAGAADGFVTLLLQLGKADGTFIERVHDARVLVRVGQERSGGLGIHEQGSELGGGDLKADFRKLLSIVLSEVISEMILEMREAELVFLFGGPFPVPAASAPIGNIAFGDGDAAFRQGPDDFGIRNVVMEEFIDQVALEFRQAGNFAIAHALTETRAGHRRGSRKDTGVSAVSRLERASAGGLDGPTLDERTFLFDAIGALVQKILQARGGAVGSRDRFGDDCKGTWSVGALSVKRLSGRVFHLRRGGDFFGGIHGGFGVCGCLCETN